MVEIGIGSAVTIVGVAFAISLAVVKLSKKSVSEEICELKHQYIGQRFDGLENWMKSQSEKLDRVIELMPKKE